MNRIAVVGAGGFAREVVDVVDAINAVAPTFDLCGYLVEEDFFTPGEKVGDLPVLGTLNWLQGRRDILAVCAVGAPELRRRLAMRLNSLGVRFATLVHPHAVLTRHISLGDGTVVTAGCILTNCITIGRHVQVNLNCTVGHDSVLKDFATLAPGVSLSGGVTVEEGSYVGTGANILERTRLGSWTVIGAGSTVLKDIPPNTTAVGVPARIIKTRDEGWHLG